MARRVMTNSSFANSGIYANMQVAIKVSKNGEMKVQNRSEFLGPPGHDELVDHGLLALLDGLVVALQLLLPQLLNGGRLLLGLRRGNRRAAQQV